MSKLVELQATFKTIKKEYKDCRKTATELQRAIIRFNNDREDLKKEILKAEKYLNLESSEEKIFQLIVYRPKVRIKKKKQTIVQQSDFIDYQLFMNEIPVTNELECKGFIDLAKKELKIWEAARSQFKKEYDLALTELMEKSTQYFSIKQKIENRIELVISKSDLPKNKKELSEYKKLYKVYIKCCEDSPAEKPTVRKLETLTGRKINKSKWNRLLLKPEFNLGLYKELNKKLNYSQTQDKKDFWLSKILDFEDYELRRSRQKYESKNKQLHINPVMDEE